MSNTEQLTILHKGVDAWNEWRKVSEGLTQIDLSNADLHRANLSMANLGMAEFQGTDLHGANLRGAKLSSSLRCMFHHREYAELDLTDR